MYHFGEKIEFRIDRRHILLFFMGGIIWTLLTFFLGMIVAGKGQTRPSESALRTLGWLDKEKLKKENKIQQQPIKIVFNQQNKTAQKTQRGMRQVKKEQAQSHQKQKRHEKFALHPIRSTKRRARPKRSVQRYREKKTPLARLARSTITSRSKSYALQAATKRQKQALAHQKKKRRLALILKRKLAKRKNKILLEKKNKLAKRKKKLALAAKKKENSIPRPKGNLVSWKQSRYVVQLKLFKKRKEAFYYRALIVRKGYRAVEVTTVEKASKGRFYRVRIGRFRSKRGAQKFLLSFQRRERIRAHIANK